MSQQQTSPGLNVIAGATGSRIVGMGHYQPERRLTNAELESLVDTNDEWILSRVGIAERRIVAPGETTVEMSVAAARGALDAAGMDAADIDLVQIASVSPSNMLPNVATRVALELGITAPAAFDLNTACSGFSYGLGIVDHAIRAGASRNALVVGAESMSNIVDYTDRSTCILFGDAAGAAVVSASDTPGIGPVVWGSDPSKGDVLFADGLGKPVQQDGQAVFRWATTQLAPVAIEACNRAGVTPDELAAVVPHQANLRIIDALCKRIGAKDAAISRDIVYSGNTSSASIPMAFSKMLQAGEIPSGQPVLFIGFGGGLTYAAQVVICP